MGLIMQEDYAQYMNSLTNSSPKNWADIANVLGSLTDSSSPAPVSWNAFLERSAKGTAFLTYDYGVDGVSIEIAKYAKSLEGLYEEIGESSIHLIGGDFFPQADTVLEPDWR